MKEISIFPNESVQRVLLGTPTGHKHLRVFVETDRHVFVFHEATLANLVRVYVTVKTHPRVDTVELALEKSGQFRPGFAPAQLVEQNVPQKELRKKLDDLFAELENASPSK